ncbi:hypothetical protein CS533_13770 [Yersinia bercovieri]|uniref:Uncharacterized protein n=1 Tax=Yersinia bercovieri TaxID=634 RepID=A0A2G4U0I8_YERBE|nr:hypothetical protein CS533_13770 [Yersinia bercovieri]
MHKKKPPAGEALLFVFAFFITRRNASQSGEGKKECEEKHFIDHRYCGLFFVRIKLRVKVTHP